MMDVGMEFGIIKETGQMVLIITNGMQLLWLTQHGTTLQLLLLTLPMLMLQLLMPHTLMLLFMPPQLQLPPTK